jgi:serine/threonine-protein kinase
MNFAPGNVSSFHSDVLQQTQLGRLCGQNQLFRDRYEILRMLGRGGFGVTFLAKDVSLPSEPLCVIKQLCPKVADVAALENARRRFEREAKILGKLGSHSQIPRLLNYFVDDGEFYLVQEYIRGSTLARLVRKSGCWPEAKVKKFLHEMLELLQYVHKQQVIHRDIKPQNIIRCKDDGRLVLIDFGAVKEQIAQAGDTSMKAPTTHFIGTVGFAPPEQFSLRPVFASDIYALGITCLYLLTGKAPLDFDSDRQTGELLWQKSVAVNESFAKVLSKMLKISLNDRYQSVESILRELKQDSSQDDLERYLLIRHQPDRDTRANREESHTSNHRSPAAKAAIAIRDWKYRMQARERQRQREKIERLLDESKNSD